MKRINMHHWLYFVMTAVVMSFAACSSDNDDNNNPSNPNHGKDNTTEMAVTGAIGKQHLWESDGVAYISIDSITGYLNLTDEIKLAMGATMEYGIELSYSPDHLSGNTYRAYGMEDGRKFIVTGVSYLKEKTTYYYRTYLGGAGYNSMKVYGKTESFTTKSIEELLPEYKVETPKVYDVGKTSVKIAANVACDTDKSKLTAENIKKGNFAIHNLDSLEEGTTYYYCAYAIFDNKYVVMGEVKDFTTEGYNIKELAKLVTVTEDGYTFTFKSQLASKYPDKDIKYGVKKYLTTSYFDPGKEGVRVYYRDRYERLTYYVGDGPETVYATGSGNTFTATMRAMEYIATGIYDSYYKDVDWYEPTFSDYNEYGKPWAGAWSDAESAEYILTRIEEGSADDFDIEIYNAAVDRLQGAYSRGLYKYVSEINEVFIEIDYSRYVIKTVKHDADVSWFTHFEFK